MISTVEDLLAAVKSNLFEYMNLKGYALSGKKNQRCINPNHVDKNPSAAIVGSGDKSRFYCSGCNSVFDTIDILCLHQGRTPSPETFMDDLFMVAAELGIKHDVKGTSPEKEKSMFISNIYIKVARALSDPKICSDFYKSEQFLDYIEERGWDPLVLKELGVGMIDYQTMADLDLPFSGDSKVAWLKQYDLHRDGKHIFGPDLLTFTYVGKRGDVLGFAARNLGPREDGSPKWVNTSATIVPSFRKSELLYGYFHACNAIYNEGLDTIYVFEGQGDVVTAYHHGLRNSVAVGTSHLSEEQIYLLRRSGATSVVICFDGDRAGYQGVKKSIQKNFDKLGDMKVQILTLPEDQDPDTFIRNYGVEAFVNLESLDPVGFIMQDFKGSEADPEHVASEMVKMIAVVPSAIKREQMAKSLSFFTDISLQTLMSEVNAIVNEKENNVKKKVNDAIEDLVRDIKKAPSNALNTIDRTRNLIQAIQNEEKTDHLSGNFFLSEITRFRELNESKGEEFPGFNLPYLRGYQEAFDNDWSKGIFFGYGGYENSGKSSFACFKTANLILPEAENRVKALYMTIDDSVEEIYRKFVCIFAKIYTRGQRGYENGFDLEINMVVRPSYWASVLRSIDEKLERDMYWAYNVGYTKLQEFAINDDLVIIGVPHVRNLLDFKRAISRLRKLFPDYNVWAFLDNIHKLPLEGGDARMAFTQISGTMKDYAVEYEVTIGGTLEYNQNSDNKKKGGRPTNASLAESRAFKYDANALVHMYNNMHIDGIDSLWYHDIAKPWYPEGRKRMPIVEAIIGKNKVSDNKMPHFMKFTPQSSWFEYMDRTECLNLIKARSEAAEDKEITEESSDFQVFDSFKKREPV